LDLISPASLHINPVCPNPCITVACYLPVHTHSAYNENSGMNVVGLGLWEAH
jgi:hypothetical protein